MTAVADKAKTADHIDPEAHTLSQLLQKGATVKANDNDASIVTIELSDEAKELYKNTLPEGLTLDSIKALKNHNRLFVLATEDAVASLGLPHAVKHAKVERVDLVVPAVGRDNFAAEFHREKSYPNFRPTEANPGDKIVKHGVVSSVVNQANGSKGELKKLRDHWAAKSAEKLASGK